MERERDKLTVSDALMRIVPGALLRAALRWASASADGSGGSIVVVVKVVGV